MSGGRSPWPARDAELTELWHAGLSGQNIAKRMGITKNAVVGRVHRLGLPSRPSPLKAPLSSEERARRAAERKARLAKRGKSIVPAAPPRLGADQCRWPIGDPKDADFRFCTERAIVGKPYCPCHMARAYVRKGSPEYAHEWNKQMATGDAIKTPESAHVISSLDRLTS